MSRDYLLGKGVVNIGHSLLNLCMFAMAGAIVGGIVTAQSYQIMVYPALIMYSITMFSLIKKAVRLRTNLFMYLLFFIIYSLFLYQTFIIYLYNTSIYPNLWWAVHGGVAWFVYILVDSKLKTNCQCNE